MNICLYGSGSRKIDEIYTDAAYELGCRMAENGHTLVFGGGDTGMMGACARGVHDNDGNSIGIAPEWIGNFEPLCERCSEFIYVDTMDERKQNFLDKSDAFIISPGDDCEWGRSLVVARGLLIVRRLLLQSVGSRHTDFSSCGTRAQ